MWLEVDALSKRFGARRVLMDLSFRVEKGEVLGVCGPNGSGKSTLLQLLAGLVLPTRGRITFHADTLLSPLEARSRIGFVSPALQLYDGLSAEENLRFFAAWRGVEADIPGLLRAVGLDPARKEPIRTWSTGMRQRVKLAWALLHGPEALLLDEPGANLDQQGRNLLVDLVGKARETGWVILASNDPEELQLATSRIDLADTGVGAGL